ncbi:MAG: tetratricopeptide repeat protein [Rhodospirillaceae bacterium]|nr:tetratricopeptide repeat protein [Rhodospirillaceae bacterium]
MTGSSGVSERRPHAGAAFAAYQAGRGVEAEAIGRAILAHDPRDAGAHYVCGLVAADRGALDRARQAFETAAALAPDKASLRITLGNLALRQGDDGAAERAFRQALAQAPGSVAAHANLGAALKRQGRLEEAVQCYRAGLALYRGSAWWGTDPSSGTAVLDPAQQATFENASRIKLEHDLAQLDYLQERGRLPPALAEARESLRRVLAGFGSEDCPSTPRPFTKAERALIGPIYNRVIYRPPEETATPALNPRLDAGAIERRYHETTPSVVVVDDLLSAPALAALQRFCLEATIWFDCKEHGGYLGAYLHEGFDHPVLIALAREMGERLGGIIGGHRLAQMWAFSYGQTGSGTRKHADKAAININLWITPDSACPYPEAAGLVVHDVAAPPDWGFSDYNLDPAPLERLVAQDGRAPVRVPYRCNRAVIFDSSLIHESGGVRFLNGYANRRINVTLLFGERAEKG